MSLVSCGYVWFWRVCLFVVLFVVIAGWDNAWFDCGAVILLDLVALWMVNAGG